MKTKLITLFAILIVLTGAGILAYPVVSNILFQNSQQELIDYYDKQVRSMKEEEKSSMLDDCREYNQSLLNSKIKLTDPFNADALDFQEHPYVDLLNQNGDGAMGSIEIPAIHCKLVMYHYTTDNVLAKGIGHLQGTSLPVGGKGTHCVLSGHTGTADKELFTNLDQLREGDVFYLHVFGEHLAYQVDNKSVVLPNETDSLYIDRDKDLVTLVTCTPYGINSHRILVRGTRISYEKAKEIEQQRGSIVMNTWRTQYIYAIIAGVGIAAVVVVLIVLGYRSVTRHRRKKAAAAAEQRAEATSTEPVAVEQTAETEKSADEKDH